MESRSCQHRPDLPRALGSTQSSFGSDPNRVACDCRPDLVRVLSEVMHQAEDRGRGGDAPPPQASQPVPVFNSSPEVIRLVVMMYIRFPLSLRNVEDLLFERGSDISHETARHWWNHFGPLFATDIRRQRVNRMRGFSPLALASRPDPRISR